MYDDFAQSIQGRSYDELNALLQQLDAWTRTADALKAAVIAEVQRDSQYRVDGHHASTAWIRAAVRCSNREALRLHRLAATTSAHPVVGEALADGRLTSCHAGELARVHSNRRVREALTEQLPNLIKHGANAEHRDFHNHVRSWEILADRDGAITDLESRFDRRTASVVTNNGDTSFHVNLPGLEGYEAREIFERFVCDELSRDLNERRRADEANEAPLFSRTADQRAADAMLRIFRAAASADGFIRSDDPIINIVVDQHTFDDAVAHATGTAFTDPPVDIRRMCETGDGFPLVPHEVLAAALRGRIRRVIYNDESVVINLGRTRRLFTGSAKTAVRLSGRHCLWPGCRGKVRDCDADHLIEHSRNGPTDQVNAGLNCPRHNRERNHGFRVERVPGSFGRVAIHRGDGKRVGMPRTFAFDEPADSPLVADLHEDLRAALQRCLPQPPE